MLCKKCNSENVDPISGDCVDCAKQYARERRWWKLSLERPVINLGFKLHDSVRNEYAMITEPKAFSKGLYGEWTWEALEVALDRAERAVA
jgi:hypothetical protein